MPRSEFKPFAKLYERNYTEEQKQHARVGLNAYVDLADTCSKFIIRLLPKHILQERHNAVA